MTTQTVERTDPMAATTAESLVSDMLVDALEPFSFEGDDGESQVFDLIDPDRAARVLVGHFSARWERSAGQRRIVLAGEWEIDPERLLP